MKFGFLYNFRNSPRFFKEWPRLYAEGFEHMRVAESLGFDSVWVPEHHLSEDGYNPAPLPLLASIAMKTTRVTIGTSVLLLPLHHPVQVAEEAAVVDNLSNGRLILGLGLGFRIAEFEGYGIDRHTRGARTEEGVEIIRRCWTEKSFSFSGKYFQLKNVTASPKPLQKPHPPIVLAARGPKAAQRAARMGLSVMPTGLDVGEVYQEYARALAQRGLSPRQFEVSGIRRVFVSHDPDKDWEELKEYVMEESRPNRLWYFEAKDNKCDLTPLMAEPDAVKDREDFIIGEPDYCVRKLKEYAKLGGMNHIILFATFTGLKPEKALASMELFAKKVMPQLR